MVTDVVPSSARFLPSFFIAHRVQQSHCSSIFHRVLLTHALALSASQFVHKKKSQRIYTSMHSAGLELTKLTYRTRLEDNLIRHRGDRQTAVHMHTEQQQQSRHPHLVDDASTADVIFYTWYQVHFSNLLHWQCNTSRVASMADVIYLVYIIINRCNKGVASTDDARSTS